MRFSSTKTLWTSGLAVMLVAGMCSASFAMPGRKKGRDGPGAHGAGGLMGPQQIDQLVDMLGLDGPTAARMKEKVFEGQKQGIAMEAELKTARVELRQLLDQDAPPRAEVMQQVDKIGALATQQRRFRIGLLLDVRAMLTPEQRAKLKKMKPVTRRPPHGPGGPGAAGPMKGGPNHPGQ